MKFYKQNKKEKRNTTGGVGHRIVIDGYKNNKMPNIGEVCTNYMDANDGNVANNRIQTVRCVGIEETTYLPFITSNLKVDKPESLKVKVLFEVLTETSTNVYWSKYLGVNGTHRQGTFEKKETK